VLAANSFTNVVCFIFVFVLVKRKFSVVLVCDVSPPQFIQPTMNRITPCIHASQSAAYERPMVNRLDD
jgi:hypothetical protein